MSRVVKFRVWDKQRGADVGMYYGDHLALKLVVEQPDTYELMQWTGLEDKNRVEIYEGDIVELHSWKPSIKETKRQVVKWIGSGLFMVRVDGAVSGHGELPNGRLEVIGNIYENPDLLETAA